MPVGADGAGRVWAAERTGAGKVALVGEEGGEECERVVERYIREGISRRLCLEGGFALPQAVRCSRGSGFV